METTILYSKVFLGVLVPLKSIEYGIYMGDLTILYYYTQSHIQST